MLSHIALYDVCKEACSKRTIGKTRAEALTGAIAISCWHLYICTGALYVFV